MPVIKYDWHFGIVGYAYNIDMMIPPALTANVAKNTKKNINQHSFINDFFIYITSLFFVLYLYKYYNIIQKL